MVDKPDGTAGGFGGLGDATGLVIPLVLGALGAYRPQASQGIGIMATMLAHQQAQQHREKQLAALEQERALDREFRGRQEVREEARTGREVAREQAGIEAARRFPEFVLPVQETIPEVPGQPQKDIEFKDVGEFISTPAVPGLPAVTEPRAPAKHEVFGRIGAAQGLDPRVAARLTELASTFTGATMQPERPAKLQRIEAARALGPLLESGGIDPTTARRAMLVAETTGQMPSMELLRGPTLQFATTPTAVLGLDARTGDVKSVYPLTRDERPLVFHTQNDKGMVSVVIVDPRKPDEIIHRPVGKDPLGAPRAPSPLTAIEIMTAGQLLAQGLLKDQVAAKIPEFETFARILDEEKFKKFVDKLRVDVSKAMSPLGVAVERLFPEAGKPPVPPGGTDVKPTPAPPRPKNLPPNYRWSPEHNAWIP